MKITFKKTKAFWLYIVLGIVAIISAIILAPFWLNTDVPFKSWGSSFVNISMGSALVLYLILYLAKKIKNAESSKVQLLCIAEFVVLGIAALGCFLTEFDVLLISRPCIILGIALWSRGSIEVARAYLYRGAGTKYPSWLLVVAILMITFGTYIFANPWFEAIHLQWIIVSAFAIFGGFLIYYGVRAKPAKPSKP